MRRSEKIRWLVSGKDDCENVMFLTATGLLPLAVIDSPHHSSITHDSEHASDLFRRTWASNVKRARKFQARVVASEIKNLLGKHYAKWNVEWENITPLRVVTEEQAVALQVGEKFKEDDEAEVLAPTLASRSAKKLRQLAPKRV